MQDSTCPMAMEDALCKKFYGSFSASFPIESFHFSPFFSENNNWLVWNPRHGGENIFFLHFKFSSSSKTLMSLVEGQVCFCYFLAPLGLCL